MIQSASAEHTRIAERISIPTPVPSSIYRQEFPVLPAREKYRTPELGKSGSISVADSEIELNLQGQNRLAK